MRSNISTLDALIEIFYSSSINTDQYDRHIRQIDFWLAFRNPSVQSPKKSFVLGRFQDHYFPIMENLCFYDS